MDLFAFIHYADPTKVLIGEREVRDGEVPLLKLTAVPLAGVNAQENQDEVAQDAGVDVMNDEGDGDGAAVASHVHKRRRKADGASGSNHPLKKLKVDHGTSRGVEAITASTTPFVTSFVTPMLKREEGGHTNFVTGPNLRTQPVAERFDVLSDSSNHSSTNDAGDEVTSIVTSSMPPFVILTAIVATICATFALVRELGTGQVWPSICRDFATPSLAEADIVGPSQPTVTELSTDSFYIS
uniref:Uncharacterized protein n=1 Tax=Tanacetum cinerariifolium TaxID=118510 RepID=A0A6L2LFL4_TANCI|nr:hypothetical protein [Tanacetum cinerariifolium]